MQQVRLIMKWQKHKAHQIAFFTAGTIMLLFFLCSLFAACVMEGHSDSVEHIKNEPYVLVLGIAQDAGFPQANCTKKCCEDAWKDPKQQKMVASLGIVDPETHSCWIIDATPDFKNQLQLIRFHQGNKFELKGIFLTHAHIGHYSGLIHLGREVMGASNVPVYAMPKMKNFLTVNGPWSQLVDLENIDLRPLEHDSLISISNNVKIKPILVPHRDEFSETVGYHIQGGSRSILFIPDIDKWSKWDRKLEKEIYLYDYLLIDGSFYQNGEIPNRDMSEIPHPFVSETMSMLDSLTIQHKKKVHFIHINHTNPLLDPLSSEHQQVMHKGYQICEQGQIFSL